MSGDRLRRTKCLILVYFRDILLEEDNEVPGAGGGGRRRGRAAGPQQMDREVPGDDCGMNIRL